MPSKTRLTLTLDDGKRFEDALNSSGFTREEFEFLCESGVLTFVKSQLNGELASRRLNRYGDLPITDVFTYGLCCEELDFSQSVFTRFLNTQKANAERFATLAELARFKRKDLLAMRNIDRTTVSMVEKVLSGYGLCLGMKAADRYCKRKDKQ
jgi:hypothetical protein